MAIVSPLYLNNWINNSTIIDATQVRAEFQNVYNALNGQLSGDNFQDGSVTTSKIGDGAVTDNKIGSVSASKISGKLTFDQLPEGLLQGTGGEITGSLVFNTNSPYIKSFVNTAVTIAEIGTGATKVSIVVNPTGNLFSILVAGNPIFSITQDGTVVPKQLRIPVI